MLYVELTNIVQLKTNTSQLKLESPQLHSLNFETVH